jgi:TolB-like protein/tetratricopeptide (TPR) repeat protein
MASLIPGYEYDIFISYRQKDNKYDGWVTEFVDNLKRELEATFKEEISVYFDINPHDGLLETHDVDASLKEKLKCLIFIPIISRTYCDPKSFAWENEFKTFIKHASQDQFGLKIQLPNGNVASRVLPIQIYNLDNIDIKLCESVLGGVLRGVEFIYTEPGVNRPLKSDDDEKLNLNKTKYRNQINKVSNALKEIISGLRTEPGASVKEKIHLNKLVEEVKKVDVRKDSINKAVISQKAKKWMIILLSVFSCMVGVFAIFKIIERSKQAQDLTKLEKSIAVLPFVNDSPDEENTYFINGIMDEIINNLQKIKDFRVISRTSVEQYRSISKLTIPEIARKLDVNYIIKGSGQKYGNTFRLHVQLIAANNEKHLWAESYEQEIKNTKDILRIQSQVAQTIASELKATITPEEKQLIEKTPPTSLTAYDFYQRGMEKLWNYELGSINREEINRAEALFHNALEYDSTFAQAYTGMAMIYWKKYYMENYLNSYLDSMLVMSDIALSYDNQLPDAYYVRGGYYAIKGYTKQAIVEWDKAIRYNPNSWRTYWGKGGLYEELDLLKSLENLQKAASLNHGSELTHILTRIGYDYYQAGFPEKGNYFIHEAFKLDGDSVKYSDNLIKYEAETQGNYKKALEYFERRYLKDSTNAGILVLLGYYHSLIGHHKESLKYYKKYISILKVSGQSNPTMTRFTRIGYSYWQNGYKKEAEYYFDKQTEAYTNQSKSVRPGEKIYWVYPLAGVYACRGDKDKVYENLKIFNQNQSFTLEWVMLMKNDPVFNNIRNEPEFQNIIRDVEVKYQAEHERVRKWLEGNNML